LILFLIFGSTPLVLVITLAAMLYLSWIELRKLPIQRMAKLAWMLGIFLTHAFGFLALLGYAQWRKRAAA
jgi:hypothetical protein